MALDQSWEIHFFREVNNDKPTMPLPFMPTSPYMPTSLFTPTSPYWQPAKWCSRTLRLVPLPGGRLGTVESRPGVVTSKT